MNPHLNRINTRLLVILAMLMFAVQILNYLFIQIQDRDLPMGNLMMGLSIYGCMLMLFRQNNLWGQLSRNPWLLPYCGYIAFSFCWGVFRYKTATSSIFDLWLFAFIPAIMLIRPFSFSAKVFDQILAVGTILGSCGLVLILLRVPEARHVRETYNFYASPLATLASGAGYLMLKHSARFNLYTLIGLMGVLTNAVGAGVVAAFRGQLLLSGLLVVLFIGIQLRTIRQGFGWKVLSMAAILVIVIVGAFFTAGSFQEQIYIVMERFSGITDAYAKTGELAQSDARLGEAMYFMDLNSNWKLILGHGVGALWYDFHGMFGQGSHSGFAGARTMLHLNWLHVTFKLGVVGFFLLLGMLVNHLRSHREFLRQNFGWWAMLLWYLAFTTYYGDKSLSIASVIHLMVLIHPWLFKTQQQQPRQQQLRHGPHRGRA